jgi:hypothetical protein
MRSRRTGFHFAFGIGAVAAAGLALTAVQAQPNKQAASFPAPAGKVSYKITSPMGSGTSDLSWVESGKKFRQDVKLKIGQGQQQQAMDMWAIADGKNLYTHQPMMGKKVLQQDMPKDAMRLGLAGLPLVTGGQDMGKVIGKGTVLGKPCEIREVRNVKLWSWKNLPLKWVMTMPQGAPGAPSAPGSANAQPQSVTVEATKLQIPAQHAATLFKVPAGFEVQKAGAPTPQPVSPRAAPPVKK